MHIATAYEKVMRTITLQRGRFKIANRGGNPANYNAVEVFNRPFKLHWKWELKKGCEPNNPPLDPMLFKIIYMRVKTYVGRPNTIVPWELNTRRVVWPTFKRD